MQSKKLLYISFLLIVSLSSFGQDKDREKPITERKIIQFTGVVFADDSSSVIPGVHIYVPKGGRGTTTNPYGFFSMPVLEGDSVIFSSVGFERTYFIIPQHDKESSLKRIFYLKEDVQYLEEVEVFPFPSEATFKAAVLAVKLPNQQKYDNLDEWVNSDVMESMYWELPASPSMNHRYFMQQQMNQQVYKVQPPANPLLNPFAWATFIRSLKKGN